jgi:hypothetical protein
MEEYARNKGKRKKESRLAPALSLASCLMPHAPRKRRLRRLRLRLRPELATGLGVGLTFSSVQHFEHLFLRG